MEKISLSKFLGIREEDEKDKISIKQKRTRETQDSVKELKEILLRTIIHKIIRENLENPNFEIRNIFKENEDLRELYNTSDVKVLAKFAKKKEFFTLFSF